MRVPWPTRRQIAVIARQEGADGDVVREALRRMATNRRVCRGEVHSPPAFFRGIVRGVLADRQTPAATVCREGSPRPNLLPSTASQPDEGLTERAASRMALRARRLFADGADHAAVSRQLKAEFPSAPSDLIASALANGLSLYRALAP